MFHWNHTEIQSERFQSGNESVTVLHKYTIGLRKPLIRSWMSLIMEKGMRNEPTSVSC